MYIKTNSNNKESSPTSFPYQLLERESLGNDEASSHYQQWPSDFYKERRLEGVSSFK